jgi:predicted peptidase
MKRFLYLVIAVLVALLASHRAVAEEAAKQKACELHRTVEVSMKYLLYLPKDYDAKSAWPLMLFLHGAGERGDDLDVVKKHGPPKLIEAGKEFPFIVVSPQCSGNRWWEPFDLAALLDEIVAKYKVDRDRIYLTGLSMGGFGTWALATYQPDRFAAIVPICGGGDPARVRRIKHIPTWVFHGGKDPTVPLAMSEKMVDALKKAGGDVKFTVYPNAAHDSWTQAYDSPELYDWLLKQKRVPRKGEEPKK